MRARRVVVERTIRWLVAVMIVSMGATVIYRDALAQETAEPPVNYTHPEYRLDCSALCWDKPGGNYCVRSDNPISVSHGWYNFPNSPPSFYGRREGVNCYCENCDTQAAAGGNNAMRQTSARCETDPDVYADPDTGCGEPEPPACEPPGANPEPAELQWDATACQWEFINCHGERAWDQVGLEAGEGVGTTQCVGGCQFVVREANGSTGWAAQTTNECSMPVADPEDPPDPYEGNPEHCITQGDKEWCTDGGKSPNCGYFNGEYVCVDPIPDGECRTTPGGSVVCVQETSKPQPLPTPKTTSPPDAIEVERERPIGGGGGGGPGSGTSSYYSTAGDVDTASSEPGWLPGDIGTGGSGEGTTYVLDPPDFTQETGADAWLESLVGESGMPEYTADEFPVPGYSSCQSVNVNLLGLTDFTFPGADGCAKLETFKDWFGYLLYVLTAYGIFHIATKEGAST